MSPKLHNRITEYGDLKGYPPMCMTAQQAGFFTPTEKVDNLDLSMVKMKLCLPVEQEGKGWTKEKADITSVIYRAFLKLCVLYPDEPIVPTKDVDEFWHAHILDTQAYTDDCQAVFGRYLHHYPYFGLKDEQDAKDLQEAGKKSSQLFRKHFGIILGSNDPNCRTGGNGYCKKK